MFVGDGFGVSMRGIADGIAADLSASAALAGSSEAAAGQFQVDLAALYKHHSDVCDLFERLAEKTTTLQSEGAANSYPASDIPGVQQALEATWGNATDGSNSMIQGLRVVLGQIAEYANAVGDVYTSYVNADSAGVSTLTAAGNPDAAAVTIP